MSFITFKTNSKPLKTTQNHTIPSGIKFVAQISPLLNCNIRWDLKLQLLEISWDLLHLPHTRQTLKIYKFISGNYFGRFGLICTYNKFMDNYRRNRLLRRNDPG